MNGRRTRRRGGRIRWLPILGFLLYGLYYYFSNQQEVPLTGRSQLVDMTREQEMALGYQSYRQILMQESTQGVIALYEEPRFQELEEIVHETPPKASLTTRKERANDERRFPSDSVSR